MKIGGVEEEQVALFQRWRSSAQHAARQQVSAETIGIAARAPFFFLQPRFQGARGAEGAAHQE